MQHMSATSNRHLLVDFLVLYFTLKPELSGEFWNLKLSMVNCSWLVAKRESERKTTG